MIKDQETWKDYVEKNKDSYGKPCVDVARIVMEFLDVEKDFNCREMIMRARKKVQKGSLSGFQTGAVVSMVSECHSRGGEFGRKWDKEDPFTG